MKLLKHYSPIGSALISEDEMYRPLLLRHLPGWGKALVFCMLNPSKADHLSDDPTIRRCVGFGARENAQQLAVINLYSLRATDPSELRRSRDPVGPHNDEVIRDVAVKYPSVICAWGAQAEPGRVARVMSIFKDHNVETLCLGTNAGGSPKHPLYIKSDQPFLPYRG